ncbi:MAG: hypothetical protein LBH29_07625 [Elusimicrobiota bacterium]|jgi:uncharacterized membrane protein|nr:hypothetical protein [Elusimicrobiota bacterium]
MTLLVDILLVVNIIIACYLGWQAGFTRSFFAVFTGFVSMYAAGKYPYQEGLNFYLIFFISVIVCFILGALALRLVRFFYMNVIDKAGGALLNAAVWLIISINVLVPTLTYGTAVLEGSTYSVYRVLSEQMHLRIPIFKNYVPSVLGKMAVEKQNILNKVGEYNEKIKIRIP